MCIDFVVILSMVNWVDSIIEFVLLIIDIIMCKDWCFLSCVLWVFLFIFSVILVESCEGFILLGFSLKFYRDVKFWIE